MLISENIHELNCVSRNGISSYREHLVEVILSKRSSPSFKCMVSLNLDHYKGVHMCVHSLRALSKDGFIHGCNQILDCT